MHVAVVTYRSGLKGHACGCGDVQVRTERTCMWLDDVQVRTKRSGQD